MVIEGCCVCVVFVRCVCQCGCVCSSAVVSIMRSNRDAGRDAWRVVGCGGVIVAFDIAGGTFCLRVWQSTHNLCVASYAFAVGLCCGTEVLGVCPFVRKAEMEAKTPRWQIRV